MSKYQYTRTSHFKQLLKRQEGNDEIPREILEEVQRRLSGGAPSRDNIRWILRDMGEFKTYHDRIPSILRHLRDEGQTEKGAPQEEEVDMECPVCFEEVHRCVRLPCSHLFCKPCVEKLTNNEKIVCPLCRGLHDIMTSHCLTEEQMDVIMKDFKENQDRYLDGRRSVSFYGVFLHIAEKYGIKVLQ
jgi:Zinc finger, C3HC4 type (RING finger)